ncbi:hypothetical protein CHN49_03250 [Pseudomonas putida]|nr:hypothetical protein CHN49_03250 [Pseudomonas putida]
MSGIAARPTCSRALATKAEHDVCSILKPIRNLWERACPRSRHHGVWHRLRRCSRARPLPQFLSAISCSTYPSPTLSHHLRPLPQHQH